MLSIPYSTKVKFDLSRIFICTPEIPDKMARRGGQLQDKGVYSAAHVASFQK